MSVIKVLIVTLLAGTLSISVALFGQRWIERHPDLALFPTIEQQRPEVLPDMQLVDLDGHSVGSHNWAGKILVMHYWASWCAPCIAQIQALEHLANHYGPSVLQVVGIAIDSPRDVATFLAQRQIGYQVLLGGAEEVELAVRFGNRTRSLPFTVIFDANGRVLFAQAGAIPEDVLGALISQARPESAVNAAL